MLLLLLNQPAGGGAFVVTNVLTRMHARTAAATSGKRIVAIGARCGMRASRAATSARGTGIAARQRPRASEASAKVRAVAIAARNRPRTAAMAMKTAAAVAAGRRRLLVASSATAGDAVVPPVAGPAGLGFGARRVVIDRAAQGESARAAAVGGRRNRTDNTRR